MAKKGPRAKIKLVSPDGDDVYYSEKNSRNTTEKLKLKKYSRRLRKHTLHTEKKK